MKYIKLVSKPNEWFIGGTEAYDYDCDESDPYRISLEDWERYWKDTHSILCRGWRICECAESENRPVGTQYFDGEDCSKDEFEITIVDERA